MFPPINRTIGYLSILGKIHLLLFLLGCSGLERSENEKLRKRNAKAEYIYRNKNQFEYVILPPLHTPRVLYPWESEINFPKISKEFFRCKGSSLNPQLEGEEELLRADCEGTKHGLPLVHGKENVYPILTDLLNYIQKKTGRRVVITCGHRCPEHNSYSDPSKENKVSKHQIGAEVDFYVQGMEERPMEIIGLLMQYYQESLKTQNKQEYTEFQRYKKSDAHVVVEPWFNKEVYIKLFQKNEGRDLDNRHPHPYISIQVRYDRTKKERVLYNWEKAHKGYLRK